MAIKSADRGDPQFDDVRMAEHAHVVDLALDPHLRVRSDDRSLRRKLPGDHVEGHCSNKNTIHF